MSRRALHLLPFLLFLAGLLYGAPSARASEVPAQQPAPSATAPYAAPAYAPPPAPAPSGPHVALLLPTDSPSFMQPAEAVRAGFMEAWERQSGTLPAHLYPVGDDPRVLLAVYRKALAAGAQLVVGPLTRNGVTALARQPELVEVPTLTLNVPDGAATRVPRLYTLSLHIEAEARQVARLALSEGRRKAFTVSEPAPLSKRMIDAFVDEFERGGGHHIADYVYTTDPASLERMRQAASLGVADMVFFAVPGERVGSIRPYMASVTGYGTSQLNPGAAAASLPDLANVRFVDMPWMVQPDHSAVMVFARRGPRLADDVERLYALGIDAARIALDLLAGKSTIDIDGVTGHLTSTPEGQFRRGLLVTLIDGNGLTILGESRP